ncbi:MAG: hypothetical protein JSU83_21805 [Deltaproteobacteria bacterium]|nr:MAG: hypothetical protein JSU83_21805 [Deltaproteobacteria bacterium]
MKKAVWILGLIFFATLISKPVLGNDNESEYGPWKKFSISLGGFIAEMDTTVRLDSKSLVLGAIIDAEEIFDLDEDIRVVRSDGHYRFSRNGRHRFDFTYYDLSRDATRTLSQDIQIGETEFNIGDTVDTKFGLVFFKAAYAYSFLMNEALDISASAGLFMTDVELEVVTTTTGIDEVQALLIPLPVIGLRANFALTPKLILKESLDLFYLKYKSFKGHLLDLNLALEYRIWKHVGLGLGYEASRIEISAGDDEDDPLDLEGRLDFRYNGIVFYAAYYF